MSKLPEGYEYLKNWRNPPMVRKALRYYGVAEYKGSKHNEVIMYWAKKLGGWISEFYDKDEIPWCGLFIGIVAKEAGYPHDQTALSSLKWKNWGVPVNTPMLGDILIFKRKGGGHVGIYVGEDHSYYHILGGNQSDSVNIMRISKDRLHAARRPKYKLFTPRSVKRVFLSAKGEISFNEA